MITQLTKKQENSIIPFRESWRKIGLSTERVDKETTIMAITKLYEKLDKKPPLFIFCPSPFWCIQQINFFKFLDKNWRAEINKVINLDSNLGSNLRSNLWNNLDSNLESNLESNLGSNLWSNLWGNLRSNLGRNLRSNLGSNLGRNLWGNLWSNLWGNLGSNLWSNLWGNLRSNLRSNLESNLESNLRRNLWGNLGSNLWSNLWGNLWSNLDSNLDSNLETDDELLKEFNEYHNLWAYGQMDSAWIGFYQFMETIGIVYDKKDSELLELWAQTAKSCSWFWTFENFVFVSDRPEKLSFDEEYRLHDEHGPAYRYTDGWCGYYLHGVNFPEDLYLKVISREMEMKDILAIQDIDQRTQAMKFAKNGLREFYKSQNGKMIDHYVKLDRIGRPVNYELWELPAGETFNKTVHFAIYNCPSGIERGENKEYSKGVPEFKTIAEAMAWGMSDDTNTISPEEWKALIPLEHES